MRSVVLALAGLLIGVPSGLRAAEAPSPAGPEAPRLIPAALARVAVDPDGGIVPAGLAGGAVESAPEIPRIVYPRLGRGAKVGAIVGGVTVGIYGAVWCNRECEGSPRAPAVQGFLIGAGAGALGGLLVGAIFDRVFTGGFD